MKLITRIAPLTLLCATFTLAQGPVVPAKGNREVPPSQNPAAKAFADKAVTLRPPAGEKVAIVIFEDLECPDCSRAHPLLMEAKKAYKIPVVVYDFPLPMHPWAFDAALYARYFRGKNAKLEAGWREYVYANQIGITSENLRQYAETFAKANKVELPFVIDTGEKLSKAVKEDFALGQRIGVLHTPTIWVVNNNASKGEPFVEVVDRSKLYELIDQMKANAK